MRKINPGPFVPSSLPRRTIHPALVLAQDADHLRQDDYGQVNGKKVETRWHFTVDPAGPVATNQ
jgi:hypothetical protein